MKPGDRAPDFDLPDDDGVRRRLGDMLTDGPVVLFFYPAAMTMGCTRESCHFRDLKAEFEELGAQRVGISADPVSRQKEFSERNGFDYPLLSDEDGEVARAYGARRRTGSTALKRATFVIGRDGIVKDVITSTVRLQVHADRALEILRAG